MKCRFFTGKFMMSCRANADIYVPSSFETQEYCRTGRHKVCPLYSKARNLDQERLFSARSKAVLSP